MLLATLMFAFLSAEGGQTLAFVDGFESLAPQPCEMQVLDLRMLWDACAPGIDCYEESDERWLQLPTIGPVAENGHLVTTDDNFAGGWPTSGFDQINAHYALSDSFSGYGALLGELWVPPGEGGSEFGQGATGAYVPTLDEVWHITMYWADRPALGTRMIVRNPVTGDAVAASAGLNTSPSANTRIAGVSEEIHIYLDTSHLDDLEIGFAVDQDGPLGPIDCGG